MKPALLVIDMQRRFLEQGHAEKLARVPTLIANANELIDFFHDTGLPVVLVQVVHKADRSTWNQWMIEHDAPALIEGTPEAEEHPDVHTRETDIVLPKTRHSAFIRTDLDDILRSRGVDTVVLRGFATDMCVGLTTIESYERDFRIMLAGDAILGTNSEAGGAMLDYLQSHFGIEPVANTAIMTAVSEETPDCAAQPRPRDGSDA
jgi:nicotinamidase-related amidase